MAKQGILWHKSNVIVLLALSHRINMSQLVLLLPETEQLMSPAACQITMLSIIWAVWGIVVSVMVSIWLRSAFCLKIIARDSIVIDYWNNKHYSGILFFVYLFYFLLRFAFIWLLHLRNGNRPTQPPSPPPEVSTAFLLFSVIFFGSSIVAEDQAGIFSKTE